MVWTRVVAKTKDLDRALSRSIILFSFKRASERSVPPESFIGTSLLSNMVFLQKNGGKGCHTGQDLVSLSLLY